MEQKLIFLDIDGTILGYDGTLPASAVTAIKTARQNGHRVYLNSGRSKAELPKKLLAIGFDGIIGGNGNYVENDGQVIFHQALPLETEQAIVAWLTKCDLPFYLESNAGLFGSPDFEIKAKPAFQAYIHGKNPQVDTSNLKVEDELHGLILGADLTRSDVNKISFALKSYQDFLDAKAAFPDLEVGTWGGKDELALFGDLRPKNITKSNAIDHLLTFLNATKEQTVAFGDAKIDIPMFTYCNLGVAMGNAGPETKAAADLITTDLTDDGLFNGFKEIGVLSND